MCEVDVGSKPLIAPPSNPLRMHHGIRATIREFCELAHPLHSDDEQGISASIT